jgi:hypothetical protein
LICLGTSDVLIEARQPGFRSNGSCPVAISFAVT